MLLNAAAPLAERGEETQGSNELLRQIRTEKTLEETGWQRCSFDWRHKLGATVLPERIIDKIMPPPVAPAFERSLGHADQLGQSLRAPVAQAGTQSRGEHHDGSPIDAPAQKAHRHWRGATTADRTTKTQTVVTLPIDIARSAARFTGIAGAVQNTATRATGGTGPGSLILIDTLQEFKELGVEQRAMAHWGVSLVLSD